MDLTLILFVWLVGFCFVLLFCFCFAFVLVRNGFDLQFVFFALVRRGFDLQFVFFYELQFVFLSWLEVDLASSLCPCLG